MPVTPERLWHALTDPSQVAGWFGGHLEWELEEGGRAWFHGDDGSERVGRVEAVRPGRHLRFRWWPVAGAGVAEAEEDRGGAGGGEGAGERRAGGGEGAGERRAGGGVNEGGRSGDTTRAGSMALGDPAGVSEVSYLLEPVAEGTRLTIQERQVSSGEFDRPQASALHHPGGGTTGGSWSTWDERLAGAWVGLAVRAFEGARA
jgi:uncharacterized protein YndB with AHSA1/START domain